MTGLELRSVRDGVAEALEGFRRDPRAPVAVVDHLPLPDVCSVVLVGSPEQAGRAWEAGARDVLVWPEERGRLLRAVHAAGATAELRRRARFYRETMVHSPLWIQLFDADGRLRAVSDGLASSGLVRTDETTGRLQGPPLGERSSRTMLEAVEMDGSWEGELLVDDWHGRQRLLAMTVVPVPLDEQVEHVVFAHEIGGSRDGSLQGWLQRRAHRPWLICSGCRVVAASPHCERVTGRAADEVLGLTLAAVGLGDLEAGPDQWVQGRVFDVHRSVRELQGRQVELLTFHDVTERAEATDERRARTERLAAARDQALAAERSKSAFLAAMSHELRSPLTPILGYAELLAEEAEGPERADLGRIRSAARHLRRLVDDLLALAHVESGGAEVSAGPVDALELLGEVRERFSETARLDGFSLVVEGMPCTLWSDRARVVQVLELLVDNALRYADPGPILLAWDGRGFVIEDMGPGIPVELHETIFEPFRRFDTQTRGTGLGLALARRTAELLGGRLELVEGTRGARFRLEIPVADAFF